MKEEEDLALLRPSAGVKLAAAVMGATGFVTLLVCLQTYSVLRMHGIVTVVVPVSFVLGTGLVFFAVQLARLRGWGAKGALVVNGLTTLASLAWFGFAFLNGFVSLLAFLLVPLSGLALFLSLLALGKAQRADAVRGRLEAGGIDPGF